MMSRRSLLKLGAATGAAVAVAQVIPVPVAGGASVPPPEDWQTIPADQLRGVAFYVNNDSRGSYFTGVHILLLQHVAALALAGKLDQMQADVRSIAECMVRADNYVEEHGGIDEVLASARESLAEDSLWGLADLDDLSRDELYARLVAIGGDVSMV